MDVLTAVVGTEGERTVEEDLVRLIVIVGLGIWAIWAFLAGLRPNPQR